MIYSGIPHTTAALFLSGSFIEKHEQIILITDSHLTRDTIGGIGGWLWGCSLRILSHPAEILNIREYDEKILIIHTDLLRISGNLESLRRSTTLDIVRDGKLSQNTLIEKLLNYGYRQSDYPGESSTYRRNGSVITLWNEDREYTLEYFDDTIESIIEVRRGERSHRDKIVIISVTPPEATGSSLTLSEELLKILAPLPTLMVSVEFLSEREYIHANFRDILECSTLTREGSQKIDISLPQISSLNDLTNFLRENSHEQSPLCITRYHKKLTEFLTTNNLSSIQSLEHGYIKESFSFQGSGEYLGEKWKKFFKKGRFNLIAEDILGSIFVQNRVRKTTIRNLDLLLKIQTGDAVVHREHGIGKYIQILSKRIGLIEREYMEIEYAAGDKVYLPMTELSRITKYVGESNPSLSSLAGKEWERTLSKTDEEIEAIAADILETDAKRSLTTRIAFGAFPDEEEKFEKAFAHIHTPDQRDIIESIRADMEGLHPMDRLIAGDVGFGKTEIAMNAVYKAVLSGVQVAVISPLLILAEEHRETFETRLGAFGVRVRSLTRMTHAHEVKNTLQAMKDGTVDVVIGTHRLLSEDIRFRRLGLLIIDEEHRFGVAQKEAIKKMKAHVDILSLSATPIPRSLHLALSGLKKISLLTTPPLSKKPIDTIVARWDESLVKQAIEIERQRKGQIIILHNRIRSLDMIAEDIRELFADNPPSIVITHGQMPPDTIEDRILAFKHGEYDILLTTTIIENGVNFLGANTIIVSDAEEFGLAQLHQIRGRVGRKDISGVCYLLYRKYELTGQERERLMILAEHSALGSGYEIAMRDMQMRGTGDILGFRQSGKTKEVGISLYFQLLEEKIQTLKNGRKEEVQCKIDLDLSYVIGDDEFDSEIDKLSFFRDIESIETLEDLDIAESTFGTENIPDSMSNLFLMMRASIILKVYGVSRVSKIGNSYHFDFQDTTTPRELRAFLERFDTKSDMIIVSVRKIKIETRHWKDTRAFLLSLTL